MAACGSGVAVPEWLDRGWRIVGTALCFTLFGLGGLALRFVAFPLLGVFVRNPRRRRARARALISWTFQVFVGVMRTVGVFELEIAGAERLARRGALVLANHPTLVDIVLLIALIDDADCIVKGALASNPFTRGPVRTAGFLCNSDGPGLVGEAIASIRGGSNLVIFPEGTRTPPSGEWRLMRGAANIAVRGGIDITPVVIRCSVPYLTKGAAWWRVPRRRARIRLEVRDDIAVGGYAADPSPARAARELTRYLSDYFAKEVPIAST
jgi:1-acyl-sn-glycerol-3-phosphate acyltransferase